MAWMRAYFELAQGLSDTIVVPIGTCDSLKAHFDEVTNTLGLEVIQYKDNPPHWNTRTPPEHIPDYEAGKTVLEHNRFVREFYDDLTKWSQSPPDEECEELTPEFAKSIWYGFSMLSIPHDRWTRDVYIEEMETLFEVLQGKERWGITFGEDGLTTEQASAVIKLFSSYFDHDDVRLDLPNGRDWLETSDETYWCPSHGCWHWQDVEEANYDYDADEQKNDGEFLVCPVDGCEEVVG